MRKFGFTLAEVLITLGIIGVVAAVTMPTLIADTKYKQIGVKLQKFTTNLENAAKSAYANDPGVFKSDEGITGFVNNSYNIKCFDLGKTVGGESHCPAGNTTTTTRISAFTPIPKAKLADTLEKTYLNDNTVIVFTTNVNGTSPSTIDSKYPVEKYGEVAFTMYFFPNVLNSSNNMQTVFRFAVTKEGNVFPAKEDKCLTEIYNNGWIVKSDMFKSGGVCYRSSYKWD